LHLVGLRITMGSRVVVDPNSSNYAVDGPGGMVTSLPGLPSQPLPVSGCVAIAGVTYAVQSFGELSFVGDPVTVRVLATN
jgi:hypothetical protein